MPKIDIPIKKLIELRPADWARYVQPGCREEWVTKFKTNYTPKKESRLDSVLEITDPGGPYLLNFEPMGYRDNALPARMLRYRSDIWEATLTDGRGTPPIRQVVVFFFQDDDNGLHRLRDRWDGGLLEYSYTVIRVWDERRQPVIARRLVGLYPLLPLMRGEDDDETPEQALRESMAAVQGIEDEALQLDLLAVMAILAGGKFPPDLVLSMIRREMVMESPIFQEWVKEERAEAEAEGKVEVARTALSEGLDVDVICKITGLSRETVLELKRELEN
ncbi:Rpn family recombination-promoting nuclease/putative transposase [Desulfallas sp. Bu1-1]|uniref:Rpn family recombination-promoting nuclease/putative transposase n=1 Tax=Desulfallas sp. Bu1-1 TaxID=2787620 RepID=UPI00189D2A62|nr:Rpn family recombination-promoting nuclease/putative transposase [Desulfallas sp. Bu1-1]MBF7081980.1 Rpn family recombination-promoting nuclease/putative transposase [Desulfallas sp. Bu1-1]